MATRAAKEWAALEEATAANLNKAAGGWLGTAISSSDQTGITTTTTLTDLSVAVTVNTSRQVLVIASGIVAAVTADAGAVGRIELDGADTSAEWCRLSDLTSGNERLQTGIYYENAASGSHTYSIDLGRSSGSGTLTAGSGTRMIVLDVGSQS